jgi:hypothetical protein
MLLEVGRAKAPIVRTVLSVEWKRERAQMKAPEFFPLTMAESCDEIAGDKRRLRSKSLTLIYIHTEVPRNS